MRSDTLIDYYGGYFYGDLLIQLNYEIEKNPDSYLTQEVYLWYDSLYRESGDIDGYDNTKICPDEELEYDFSSIEEFLFSITKEAAKSLLKDLTKSNNKR